MNTALPFVSIVIVAYNHAAQLPATLAAVRALDYPADLIEIVLVDNGGEASGFRLQVSGAAPSLRVLEPGRNLGFAGGNNEAIRETNPLVPRPSSLVPPVVVLINPDLQPRPDFLRAIVAPLADPAVGVVGAKLLLPHGRIQHAGGFLLPNTLLAHHTGYDEADHGQYDHARDVPFVTGAALAIRRELWDELGGLDEAFWPAYYEDVDLCWRVRERGLAVRYEPRAVAIHAEAAGLGKGSAAYHRLFHRNRLRLLWKHGTNDWLLTHWLPAELIHLRATADDHEIDGLIEAYVFWQAAFFEGDRRQETGRRGDGETGRRGEKDLPTFRSFDIPTTDHRPATTETEWTLQQLERKRTLRPLPFRSRWPIVAALRTIWNKIATETYLRPIIQQQNDYNAAVAEFAQALARQRRTTDAAVLCQGTLLAKLAGSSQPDG